MRNVGAVLGAGVLLVLVAGCARQVDSAAGPAITTSTPAVSGAAGAGSVPPGKIVTVPPGLPAGQMPPDAVAVPAGQVDAVDLPASYSRQVWSQHGGTVLGLVGDQGGCRSTTATLTSQTATEVTIRLAETATGGGGAHACPMYLMYKPITVTLAAPLGTRTVVLRLGG